MAFWAKRDVKQIELENIEELIEKRKTELAKLNADIETAKSNLINYSDEELLQSFALYSPTYAFASSDIYKDKLIAVRERQKELIKTGNAVSGFTNWTVNNSKSQGQKMVSDTQKLLLRAFNSECDYIIDRVRVANIDASEKRIAASRDAISKLGKTMGIEINEKYYLCKITELYLALEYQQKKQDEKEEQKEARAQLREQAKLLKELEAAREKLKKEKNHYLNALSDIERRLTDSDNDDISGLQNKKAEILAILSRIETDIKAVDLREANQKAGNVYVISNIGAFGENVYKIGMTRRENPYDRINELSDASVPFNFDVHAMIFSDDAPALEAALHREFADRKLNAVNPRREFFRVSLDEIKAVVRKNFDKTVEFVDVPAAEQFRQSLCIRQTEKP